MTPLPRFGLLLLLAILCLTPTRVAAAEPIPAAQLEFFETKIRPVLVEQCYACHNSAKTAKGGLALDDRASTRKGGNTGPLAVAGKPEKSLLIQVLKHEVEGQAMPKNGPKLDAKVIADFEKWIALGLPDPRDKPPTAEELGKATSWAATLETRKKWWSFQPSANPPLPPESEWAKHPIDRFIAEKLLANKLEPNAPADSATLVRRLYFTLIGLPPSPTESAEWTVKLKTEGGYEALVDHLLASPQFGERWARHWMDWTRYADSHGSEGDPDIAGGWRYRDYLIRALNADVPYDQLVREHVAGDLLAKPRINAQLKLNESAIGTAHWRMVFHGFAPTDALEEKVRFIDDQINTFSKAFLGLTVACARCHDHKFDAISQKDYTALYGVLASNRPGRHAIDSPEVLSKNRDELMKSKPQIREALARDWYAAIRDWSKSEKELPKNWLRDAKGQNAERDAREQFAARKVIDRWNFVTDADWKRWFATGTGLESGNAPAGEFALRYDGIAILGVYPRGVYSHAISTKHAARLESKSFVLNGETELWVQARGDGGAKLRYVVQDYPRDGTVFPVYPLTPQWHWYKLDLAYWAGDRIHIELATAADAPLMASNAARSWFGIRGAVLLKKGDAAPPAGTREFLDPVFDALGDKKEPTAKEFNWATAKAIRDALSAWVDDKATDSQMALLEQSLADGLLPNGLEKLKTVKPLIEEYRKLEAEIAVPTRVPGLMEGNVRNQELMERGDHKRLKAEVPRRFLEAIDNTPYIGPGSGRLQLGEDLVGDKNPLTRRVIVNRVWHHLFGRGIVPTPDNFGRLGLEPTHPELLDFLATRFRDKGWSIKEAIRFIVTSKTWQLASKPSENAKQLDPDNRYFSHAILRRLEAEAIRDALLAVSGSLSREMFGPPGDGNSARRSVYVRVQRTALDPFLRTFDFPEPFSTTGRRDVTNVPAQSLTLMNDPRVASLANNWAGQILADQKLKSDDERIQRMIQAALGRPATTREIAQFQTYIAELKAGHQKLTTQVAGLRGQMGEQQVVIRDLLEPMRSKLMKEAKEKPLVDDKLLVKPIGQWEFQNFLKDLVGPLHGEAVNGAKLQDGALKVGGQAHAITVPLKKLLREKTLEVWVQLDTLDQAGGAAMTIQTKDGGLFDAIVFGEKDPGQWVAGSNFFQRTQSLQAPKETEAAQRVVHLAITYGSDGKIAAYRDGQPYGQSYKTSGPLEFKAGEAVVGFGIRHSPAGGNKVLAGKIVRAKLYDKALSANEVLASFGSVSGSIPESKVLESLKPAEREVVEKAKKRIAALETEIAALGPIPAGADDRAILTDVAKAIFSFREFITLK